MAKKPEVKFGTGWQNPIVRNRTAKWKGKFTRKLTSAEQDQLW